MWVLVMFDLPVLTKKQRKIAALFRKKLLLDGFTMMQYSVYLRPCPSEENAVVHVSRVRNEVPPDGHVRILKVTDKQFGRMECFFGKKRANVEQMPRQTELF